MDALAIYAIAAGSILTGLFLIRTLSILADWRDLFSFLISQHLTLPFLVHRHQLCGPWTRGSVLIHVLYVAVNVFLVFFRVKSLTTAGHRAGELALINLIFPLSNIHLSHFADLLGITLHMCRKIHRASGCMALVLLSFHVIVAVQAPGFSFSLQEPENVCALIGSVSLGLLTLLSIPWLRQLSYEIFLRGHQILAIVFAYCAWGHLPVRSRHSRFYLLAALGIFALTSFLQLMLLLYRNGLFAGHGFPRALVSFTVRKSKSENPMVTATHVCILLPRPVEVEAGQYINLWIPSVSLWSWAQTHPFTVTSWSKGPQNTMQLLVEPRRGLSADLLRYAPRVVDDSASFLVFFTGPHGTNVDASQYESVLVVASGFGIAAAVPHLKKLIHGYNTCTSHVRRLHLVWQVESISEIAAALDLLNSLLEDDVMDAGYILNISIYVENGLEQNKLPFGQHKRVFFYQGEPDYQNIIALETSGEQVKRLSNIQDKKGEFLVMLSTTAKIRDCVRETVIKYLRKGVKLSELEYQPSSD